MATEKKFELINEAAKRLNVYHVENMESVFSDRKGMPSRRIFETKKGKRALKGLKMIEEEMNCSWYHILKTRWSKIMDHEAIFYRGNVITAKEMFERADRVSRALLASGVEKGDELACCMSNVPEVIYLMLGANQIGAKLNFFGAHYDSKFVDIILDQCSEKLFIATDDEAEKILEKIEAHHFENKVIVSLADSLPEHPEECEGYEAHLDRFYHYENKAAAFAEKYDDICTFADFLKKGENYTGAIIDDNTLDTEFLVTYTSGSTKIGFPKQEIHRNRSLITVGVFHDPELCGNPACHGLRGMAHLHTDTDTNLITTISDGFFQEWSVAMEPEYGREIFLDYLFINKPNFVLATTGFWLGAAREYLIDGRYHDINGKGRTLPWLLADMAVGEACQPGEEKFINQFFKEAKAGSGVNLAGPFHLPYVTIGVGGGDTEHGGIYYTLFRRMQESLNGLKLRGKPYGLDPVPYAQASVLKQGEDGTYHECGYNEYGIIVANSATNMAGYKNFEKIRGKVMTDDHGVDWLSCDVFGYIDKFGSVHMKDRKDSLVVMENGNGFLPFRIADEIQKDPANVMTSVITTAEVDGRTSFIVNLEFSPLKKVDDEMKIYASIDNRLKKAFPDIYDRILYRQFDAEKPFPCAASGKRNMVAVQNMDLSDVFALNGEMEMIPLSAEN